MATGIPARLTSGELRSFGLTLAVPFAILAGAGAWRGVRVLALLAVLVAAGLLGLAVAAPRALAPVHRGWMAFAHALGWVNTRVLLAIVYYAVMAPTGLVMRLLGRDPLSRALGDRPSYWIRRQRQLDRRRAMELHF